MTVLFFGSGYLQAQIQSASKIDEAMQIIKYAYVDTINEKKLTDDALRTILKDLDPHSSYIPAEEMQQANEPLVGKFEGVGIQFNIHNDTIMVTQTIPGGPSEKLGIRAGDRIVKIDGQNVASVKITNNDVLKKLRGNKGTKVTVGIARRGMSELLDFTITRDQIPLFSVDATYQLAPGIGYIKITRFADQTVEEFRKALAKLKAENITSLVLDLQDNGGGYLNRAVELADEFLPEGKKIVYTRGRAFSPEDYYSTATGGWEKGKLVVLLDEASASASEIVSGAIQDWDRGILIGRRSFGKGLVQKPFQLSDGSMMRVTIAHYYTPSGRCIQKPYSPGDDEEYDLDISRRLKHGELTVADSIHFNDTTKYFTNNKRLVFGGGGIMPDIFVPLDTSLNSNYYFDLLRKNTFNDFILSYMDEHRSKLKESFADIHSFRNNFKLDQKTYDDFLAFGEKQGVKKDPAGLKTSEKLIKLELRALIARNLWDTDAFFEIVNEINPLVTKAVEVIQSNTFEKMKIATR
ncbi:MAG: S41 family peptidase [Bacteroidetes bacterium]|nr:S41 family peptidase [Bacteroidota bacterium]